MFIQCPNWNRNSNSRFFMHWLHVNPNSDFSTFGHFFDWICQVFLQNLSQNLEEKQKPNSKSLPNHSLIPNIYWNFARKMLKVCQVQIMCQNNDQYQSFQYFSAKYLPNNCKYWPKYFKKSAEKVPKSREIRI